MAYILKYPRRHLLLARPLCKQNTDERGLVVSVGLRSPFPGLVTRSNWLMVQFPKFLRLHLSPSCALFAQDTEKLVRIPQSNVVCIS